MLKGRVASLLEVGTGFHPEFTGREKHLPQRSHSRHDPWGEARRKFDEIVAFAEVEAFLDTPVKLFLRHACAAGLCGSDTYRPEVLIGDEVLVVGDAEFQKKCFGRMDEVSISIPRLLFYPGTYSIDLWLGDRYSQRTDFITDAVSFDVIETSDSDFVRPLNRSNGLVFQSADWSIGEADCRRPATFLGYR